MSSQNTLRSILRDKHHHRDAWECDFVTDTQGIQVCTELTTANLPRELAGLAGAAALRGRREPLILTLDQRDPFTDNGCTIQAMPAWEWRLGE